MQDSAVAGRLREQIEEFSGTFYPRFSKPQGAFLTEMLYGIQAAQDVKLSNIARVLGEPIKLKKTEERLSHHLAAPGMSQTINRVLAEAAADQVKEDTLVVVAAYFAAEWLGEGMRLAVLRRMVAKLAKRFFGVPAFHYYALADGIRNILARAGRWRPSQDDLAPPQPQPRQLLLF